MITGFNGQVTLTWTTLYFAILWLGAGVACTVFTRRRGLYIAILFPLIVAVLPQVLIVNPPGGVNPFFQFFRMGGDLTPYWDEAIIPFFASVVGGLIGELISPSEEE